MLVNSLNQTKSSFSHVFTHDNIEITAIYGGLNYSNPIYYAFDTINGAPPLSFKSNGEAIEDYTISGNTVQNGTPTPSNPVDVVGCGTWDATHQSYKLPISVNNTEYPIYLGQVQTTRKIKKLVLDGTENWRQAQGRGDSKFFDFILAEDGITGIGMCTHFSNEAINADTTVVGFRISSPRIRFRPENVANMVTSDFVAYLAAQYAAGTPVTVWYVLAVPQTTVVNEPLHKISTYADTINSTQSGIEIPTINGTNTLTTSTTVLPSNIEATGRIKRIV